MTTHATPGDLCTDACRHICDACEHGGVCVDLFTLPGGSVVACMSDEVDGDPEDEGCDCTELCAMGSTCPGGMLAGLPDAGCWRGGEA